jgi:hypothetical protein
MNASIAMSARRSMASMKVTLRDPVSERRCLQREIGAVVERLIPRPAERTLKTRPVGKLIRRLASRAANGRRYSSASANSRSTGSASSGSTGVLPLGGAAGWIVLGEDLQRFGALPNKAALDVTNSSAKFAELQRPWRCASRAMQSSRGVLRCHAEGSPGRHGRPP